MKARTKRLTLQVVIALFLLTFCLPLGQAADVTFTVGSVAGLPDPTNTQVEVSVEVSISNPAHKVGGIQAGVCEELMAGDDSYLTVTDVTVTERTAGFSSAALNLGNGCSRVIMFSTGQSNSLVQEGEGPVFSLTYEVSSEASEGECRNLNPENVIVSDEFGSALDVASEAGLFCFGDPGSSTTTTALSTTTTVLTTTTTATQTGLVTVTVGDGSGPLDSTENLLPVRLENLDDPVAGLQFDLCLGSAASYLTLGECETVGRASDYSCVTERVTDEATDCDGEADRVIVWLLGTDTIGEGTGAVVNLNYDVSSSAPEGYCENLTLKRVLVLQESIEPFPAENIFTEPGEFCVPCTFDVDCDDGLFCNGTETCMDDVCLLGDDPCPGQTCNEGTDSCETSTTTTVPPITTTVSPTPPPPPPPNTTTVPPTTTIPPSYSVSISPWSVNLNSGATLQFNAKTSDSGEEVDGTYDWEIVPGSIIGSEIDDKGLFTAGVNATVSDIKEKVRVTDTDHGHETATATVTVKVMVEPPPECEVAINPSSAIVSSGSTLTLEAETTGGGCEAGDYEWLIESDIGSVIDQGGNYTAGINKGTHVADVITVVDHANADITASATMTIGSKTVTVFPDMLLGSRWIPLPYLLMIAGEDTTFLPSSTVEFEPNGDIIELGQIGLGDIFFTLFFLNANPQEGTVSITINTGEEIVTGEVTIELLPLPFAEEYPIHAVPFSEVSLDRVPLFGEKDGRGNLL